MAASLAADRAGAGEFMKWDLSDAEKARIKAAVLEAEKASSAEVVVWAAPVSDRYEGARWRAAVTIMFVISAVLYFCEWRGYLPWEFFLPLQSVAVGVGYALGCWPPLMRLFLRKEETKEETHQRALEIFQAFLNEHKAWEHPVFFAFASVLEHRWEILASAPLASKISPEDLVGLGKDFPRHAREQGVAHALEMLVKNAVPLLAQAAPPTGTRHSLPDTSL